MFRRSSQAVTKKDEKKKVEFECPMDELNYLLDSLDNLINQSMDEFVESIRPPPPQAKPRRSSVMDSLKMLRNGRVSGSSVIDDGSSAGAAASSDTATPSKSASFQSPTEKGNGRPPSAPNSGMSSRSLGSLSNRRWDDQDAKFLPMDAERVEDFVETIRRVAELVIIGERSQAKSGDEEKAQEYIAVFETFFERQGLATITNILIGTCFDLFSHPAVLQQLEEPKDVSPVKDEEGDIDTDDGEVEASRPISLDEHTYKLLPPLPIATQAIQSVSILVQNVSRATSLFFILSNNHVNELINFPLDLYVTAERSNHDISALVSRKMASPEIAELTTHFITFMKSLAMRMTAETLQFFLTYPNDMSTEEVEDIIVIDTHAPIEKSSFDSDEDEEDRPMDETEATAEVSTTDGPRPVSIKTVKVEFPLYERALEFCSAHQDSFIRVTAMNICLNTLRIATVIPTSGDDENGDADADLGKSPDGVLHNAKPLPLKERVAIAQYVCTPARVERLASPIFTKLAQLWGALEEQFRDMDTASAPSKAKQDEDEEMKLANAKLARAKEKARRQKAADAFNDTAYTVQDELLLLEDVLKVGLTSLNEQMIEMMFATFVYPLLLQPLLLYFQRSEIPNEVLFADPLRDHSAGRPILDSDLTATENSMLSAPAKSAFFCLTAAFQFLTNPPLLRLMFTALFHPLAPEATGETMIRAKADVACLDPDGKVEIRIDPIVDGGMKTMTDRSTYVFGTITGEKCVSSRSANVAKSETSCVFVLAPALAEILEFRGHDPALVARTRQNPYRKAIFQCFSLCSQLSDLRPLSVLAVETAVSKFSAKFLSDILFGADLQKFQEALPADEIDSNSVLSRLDDRDIGGGTIAGQSRLSLGESGRGKVGFDYRHEVLSAFRSCIMRAIPAGKGTWKLEFDLVAAHALVCIIRGNKGIILDAAKRIDKRCRQAAEFLSDIPHSVERFAGSKLSKILKGLEKETHRNGSKIEGTIMDVMFRGHGDLAKSPTVLNDLLLFKPEHSTDDKTNYAVAVTEISSYSEMCSRCCALPPLDADVADGALRTAMGSARAWVKLDAFSNMLNSLVATGGSTVRDLKKIGGFAVKSNGYIVSTPKDTTVYAPISEHFLNALCGFDGDSSHVDASPGKVVSLVGHVALPCVCEVPPSSAPLFSAAGAKVVSQGITWQSLYLVLLGRHFVLAEPERRASGDGRIVTRCPLERISVAKDAADARADTTARRLIVSYQGLETTPPGLFLFEETPKPRNEGPFVHVKQWHSSLDIWFEDNKSVTLAFKEVGPSIDEAKVNRGIRIQRYLAQEEDSGYPRNLSLYSIDETI